MTLATSEAHVRTDGLLLGGFVFLLLVMYSSALANGVWLPRASLLLLASGAAFPYLVYRATRRSAVRPAALTAAAFVAVALISAALAKQPVLSLTGELYWGTGAIFTLALASLWAAGTIATRATTSWVTGALVAGAAVNLAVAVLQTLFDTARFGVTALEDRATGLLGNPIHLGSVGVACALVACRRDQRSSIPLAVLGALAVQLSGTRVALGVLLLGAVLALARRRGPQRILIAVAIAAGLAIGALTAHAGEATTGVGRAGSGDSSGFTSRTEVWRSSLRAVADRPLLGSGPGRFHTATSRYRTLEAALAESPERLFYDAHNLLIEHLVTTGFIGAALLVAWLVLAVRQAKGPLAWAALGMLAIHLVQPMSVSSTPLAFVLLGVAAGHAAVDGERRSLPPLAFVSVIPGLVAATTLLYVGFHIEQAELDFDLAHNEAADQVAGWWPELAFQRARILVYEGTVHRDQQQLSRAVDEFGEAARRDPSNPSWWNLLGDAHRSLGDPIESGPAYRRALSLNPWSARALIGSAAALVDEGEGEAALELLRRADIVSNSARIEELRTKVESAP